MSFRYIYVASFTEGKIYVFSFEKDGNLTSKGVFILLGIDYFMKFVHLLGLQNASFAS